MHPMAQMFGTVVSSGLSRKSIMKPSTWAKDYRRMGKPFPGPWTFKWHPWLETPMDSQATFNVTMKGAQLGFTELALNLCFFEIDIQGNSIAYILPNQRPDASDFSAGRFDPAINESAQLRALFSDTSNTGLKRSGTRCLYIRGSNSRSSLKSIPVSVMIFDEEDEHNQANLKLALERTSGQMEEDRKFWSISTPTIFNFGVHKKFMDSTEEHFFFKCPSCSRMIMFEYPECLVITADSHTDPAIENSHYICTKCKNKIDQAAKPEIYARGTEYVPKRSLSTVEYRGFAVSQLYSCTMSPVNIAKLQLESEVSEYAQQELHNSKLGLPYEAKGARIHDSDIDAVVKKPPLNDPLLVTMGVDIGSKLNFVVTYWYRAEKIVSSDINLLMKPVVADYGEVTDFDELDNLIQTYGIVSVVLDAQPEVRKVQEFCAKWPGIARACRYVRGISGKQIKEAEADYEVTVDRTSWLDLVVSRFKNRSIDLPLKALGDKTLRDQLKASVRVHRRDKDGQEYAVYIHRENDPDHYMHAFGYTEVGLRTAQVTV